MTKMLFKCCLLLLGLILTFDSAYAQARAIPKQVFYKVVNVVGTVTLYGKPLKKDCNTSTCVGRVAESDISSIRVGLNSYFQLEAPAGRTNTYGASSCGAPPCAATLKVVTVNRGPRKEILEGTQADLDQITALFNRANLEQVKTQELKMDKQLELQKVDAPQQQLQINKVKQLDKVKAGGGR